MSDIKGEVKNDMWAKVLIVAALLYAALRYTFFADYLDSLSNGNLHLIFVFIVFCIFGIVANTMDKIERIPAMDNTLPLLKPTILTDRTAGMGLFAIFLMAVCWEFFSPTDSMAIEALFSYFWVAVGCFTFVRNRHLSSEFILVKALYMVVPLLFFLCSLYFLRGLDFRQNLEYHVFSFLLLPLSIPGFIACIKHKRR